MKLYRYMSCEEFKKLMNGEELENENGDEEKGIKGRFFFLPVTEEEEFYLPFEFMAYAAGCVSDDVLVEFECDDETPFYKSIGDYGVSFEEEIKFLEFSIEKYDKEMLKPLRYMTPPIDENNEVRGYEYLNTKEEIERNWKDITQYSQDKRTFKYTIRKW